MGRAKANSTPPAKTPTADAGAAAPPARPAGRITTLLPAALTLAVGVALWATCLRADVGSPSEWGAALVAVAAASVPAVRRRVVRFLDRIRRPSPATATKAAVVISLTAATYLGLTAYWQGADFVLRLTDEPSYLIQARMLAAGRLWMPPHPAAIRPFFDTFNFLVEPTYGSMYFPGTALFYVPAVWLKLPYWCVSLALSGACVGAFYRLMVELVDGAWAAVAAVMLLGVMLFRTLSVMLLSQTPMLLLGLLLVLAYVRWRKDADWRFAAAIGLLAGWAGVTRPADALVYAVPIGLAMAADLWFSRRQAATVAGSPTPARRVAVTAACLVLPALPFLSLQVVQNVGMTGHWWEFPEARYADETYPAPMLGFHAFDPAGWRRPALPQKRRVSEMIADAFYAKHRPADVATVWWESRLPQVLRFGLPTTLMAILVPAGVLGLKTRPRRVLAVTLAFFVGFYAFYVFFIPHYMVVVAPALILLAISGAMAVERDIALAIPRSARLVAAGGPLLLGALAVGSLPELNLDWRDDALLPAAEIPVVERAMDDLARSLVPGDKAIVFFRYDPASAISYGEPVYNADVAWPDDAKVVRAHDRGEDNLTLLRYFAIDRREPQRAVFLYDRKDGQLTRLGTAGQMVFRDAGQQRNP